VPILRHYLTTGEPIGLNVYDSYVKNDSEATKLKGLILLFSITDRSSFEFVKKNSKPMKDFYHVKLLVGTHSDEEK
jgi:hypothetical protein